MQPTLIDGMHGLGDNINQRAVLRAFCAHQQAGSVYLVTPWPQLYADLPLRCVRPSTRLRTQRKNAMRANLQWAAPPHRPRRMRIAYGHVPLQRGNILQAMGRCLALRDDEPLHFDLPRFEPPELRQERPVCLIRPVTIRREWRNEARNPDPRALRELSERLAEDYFIVSVADLKPHEEWLPEGAPLPFAHLTLHAGELNVERMLGLVQSAALVVGGVGWIVPAAVASRTPGFFLLGGMGGHNSPEVLLDPRMPTGHLGWATPARFCRCTSMLHDCDKRIENVNGQFDAWARRHLRGAAPRRPSAA